MEVGIDQDKCTGCGICEMMEPEVFFMVDQLAYVKQAADEENGEVPDPTINGEPLYKGILGLVGVPVRLRESVIVAEKDCPGECIVIKENQD